MGVGGVTETLKSPYPYFGGKARVAPLIWERFGDVDNLVDPFFGSGAVLLGAPWPADRTETVNDLDGHLTNFWRAIQADPDAVAEYADWPVSEIDLHARHRWLVNQRADVERMLTDPAWYDAKAAGWWVWGISQWIGSGWCPVEGAGSEQLPRLSGAQGVHRNSLPHPPAGVTDVGDLSRKIPHVGDAGRGVHRASHAHALWQQRPDVSSDGRGVAAPRLARQLPYLNERNGGESAAGDTTRGALPAYFRALSARLRRVRITCGDWTRVLGPSVTWRHGVTAIILDPPYRQAGRADVYGHESDVFDAVCAWAAENGDNPLLRIAVCGYEGDWTPPAEWETVRWKAPGGYAGQGNGRGKANRHREAIWFSPHCVNDTPIERAIKAAAPTLPGPDWRQDAPYREETERTPDGRRNEVTE